MYRPDLVIDRATEFIDAAPRPRPATTSQARSGPNIRNPAPAYARSRAPGPAVCTQREAVSADLTSTIGGK
jgi:hypothetical protein